MVVQDNHMVKSQGFSYSPEQQKFKMILIDGNNVKQCATFLKTILEIRRSELMKP